MHSVRVEDTCTSLNGGKPFLWKVSGGDKFAGSQSEAFSDAKLDIMLRCNRVPVADWAAIKAQLRDPKNASAYTIAPGDHVGAMMSGSGIYRSTTSALPGPQLALRFEFDANGTHYVFILPLECWNWIKPPALRPGCALIVFETRTQEEIGAGIPVWGDGRSDRCHGIVDLVVENGEFRIVSKPSDIAEGCIRKFSARCSYAGADRMARPRVRTFSGSVLLSPGLHGILVSDAFSVNQDDALGICVKVIQANGGRISSQTAIVRDIDYVTMRSGQRVARVWYSDRELPEGIRENDPYGLFLWRTR